MTNIQRTFAGFNLEQVVKDEDARRAAEQRAQELERRRQALEGKKAQPPEAPVIIPPTTPVATPLSYLILPSKRHGSYEYPDLLVSTERSYLGQNWEQCQNSLHNNGELMLTIRQFVDLLNLLKSGKVYDGAGKQMNSAKVTALLEDITAQRDPYRAEWLDASFSAGTAGLAITYHNIRSDRTLEQVTEPLAPYLQQDKTPGIDFQSWLQTATVQGLPSLTTPSGSLYYWKPAAGYVASFWAVADRVSLLCQGWPADSNSALGVRGARPKI